MKVSVNNVQKLTLPPYNKNLGCKKLEVGPKMIHICINNFLEMFLCFKRRVF